MIQKVEQHLEIVCTSIIQRAASPIAVALYLSSFMNDLAQKSPGRGFEEISQKFFGISNELMNMIESDHLLALLFQIPTQFNSMNIFDIAIQLSVGDFFNNTRVDRIVTHMYQQYYFLRPDIAFAVKEINLYDLFKKIVTSPATFYYCPIGKWW
eukprot:162100_1